MGQNHDSLLRHHFVTLLTNTNQPGETPDEERREKQPPDLIMFTLIRSTERGPQAFPSDL